jgi:hypothetical protein
MCGSALTLTYTKREAFLKGLDDLIAKPTLTMMAEFARDDRWVDWKGVGYRAQHEWAYTNGPARTKEGCTPGTRDANNDGKTPQQFLEQMNNFINSRREQGHGVMLPDEHAFLNLDEVIAVRLYSGPAYQPINTFLRQISSLTDAFRHAVGQHPGLTYAATVGHICRAIRKLAAVATPDEAKAPLWRGVRGKLEKAFWLPDSHDMVCAVDQAFMSTSRSRKCTIDYMDPRGENVLWQLHPKPESDTGFHRGASIDMLSQFAGEEEVLFPPYTMLVVKEEPRLAKAKRAGDVDRARKLEEQLKKERGGELHSTYEAFEREESDRKFMSIDVLPVFL